LPGNHLKSVVSIQTRGRHAAKPVSAIIQVSFFVVTMTKARRMKAACMKQKTAKVNSAPETRPFSMLMTPLPA